MKVKEASAKMGLLENIKKIKIMTIEEIYNLGDNENIEIVKEFAYLGH